MQMQIQFLTVGGTFRKVENLGILGHNETVHGFIYSLTVNPLLQSWEKPENIRGFFLHFQTCKNHTKGNFYNKYSLY